MTVIRPRSGSRVFSLEYIESKLGSMPVPFASYAGKFLRVDPTGTFTEWAAIVGGGDMLGSNNLSDLADFQVSRVNLFPSMAGQSGNVVAVNATEDDLEYITVGGPETDPIFGASVAAGIVGGDITNWDAAFGWGNHASAGYATTAAVAAGYQPLDADLTTIAGLTATTDNFLVSVSSAWASRTPSQVRTTLGLVIGTNVQAWDAQLDSLATLAYASNAGKFIRVNGAENAFELAAVSATLADGDYGDVSITSSGTTFTVESVAGEFALLGVQTDTTSTTGSLNDYALNANVTELRFNCVGQTLLLKGIAGGYDGRLLRIVQEDTTGFAVLVSNEQISSAAANRIHCLSSIPLQSGLTSILLKYDGSISRWTLVSSIHDYTSSGIDLTGTVLAPTIKALAITNAKVNDVAENKITFTDITTGNFSTSAHGYTPKGTNIGSVLLDDGNWGTQTKTSGVGTSPTSSSTQTITHGLGRTPTCIEIYGGGTFTSNAAATATPWSIGMYTSSGNTCVYQRFGAAITTTQAALTSTAFAILLATGGGNYISGVIQNITSTQFDIVWTETGTATAQPYLWKCG